MSKLVKRKFPVGIQEFDTIIEGGFVYIDKTQYIYDMTTAYQAVFLARPRRFGKTLLSKTIEMYFRGRRDLFKGLAIDNLENKWNSYPAIRIDMSEVMCYSTDEMRSILAEIIVNKARENDVSLDLDIREPGYLFGQLIESVAEKAGKKVVVIVDEYDSPLLEWMGNKEEQEKVLRLLGSFYIPLKNRSENIKFAFVTGITNFSQVSIFSSLNNLVNISMMPEYAAVCGVSREELERYMIGDIEYMAAKNGKSVDEIKKALRDKYDGYHFCIPSDDIYNPFSLINALDDGELRDYWFDTGTPSFLFDFMKGRSEQFDVLTNETLNVGLSTFSRSVQSMTDSYALLYQSGYLTIKDKIDDKNYVLGFPNNEVKSAYSESFVHYLNPTVDVQYWSKQVRDAVAAADIDTVMQLFTEFFAKLGYDLNNRTEAQFQTVFVAVFLMLSLDIRAEYTTSNGRIDAILFARDVIVIFEFKLDKSPEKALDQIDRMDYFRPWLTDSRRKIAVGVAFDWQTRGIGEWKTFDL